jgi:hypothetical protein
MIQRKWMENKQVEDIWMSKYKQQQIQEKQKNHHANQRKW